MASTAGEALKKQGQETMERSAVSLGDSRLLAIHYECGMVREQPVPVHCIGVKNLLGGQYEIFYCQGNEAAELERFAGYLEERRDCVWVVWNMRNANYGFPHILGRLRELGGRQCMPPPPELMCDLGLVRWQLYGDFTPGPDGMLLFLARANGIPTDGMMKAEDVQAAIHTGNQSSVVRSVQRKLDILDSLWWRFRNGTLSVQPLPEQEGRATRPKLKRGEWVEKALLALYRDATAVGKGRKPKVGSNQSALAREVGVAQSTVQRYMEANPGSKLAKAFYEMKAIEYGERTTADPEDEPSPREDGFQYRDSP